MSSLPAPPARALIAEDDPLVARSIARRLLREGYTVSLAQTCRAARGAGSGFHVAVLDLDLPDGNGADLAAELLRLGAVRHVVFFTGSLDAGQRARASGLGVVLDKTSDLERVIEAIEPFPTAPPISELSPAPRQRPRTSTRVARADAEDSGLPDSLVEARSSRR